MDEIHLWRWRFANEFGKRVKSSWLMTEDTVKRYGHVYRDAEKVGGSLEIRKVTGSTTDWHRSPPKS
jgi:hypothetical protein